MCSAAQKTSPRLREAKKSDLSGSRFVLFYAAYNGGEGVKVGQVFTTHYCMFGTTLDYSATPSRRGILPFAQSLWQLEKGFQSGQNLHELLQSDIHKISRDTHAVLCEGIVA